MSQPTVISRTTTPSPSRLSSPSRSRNEGTTMSYQETFTKAEVASKTLIYEAYQMLKVLRDENGNQNQKNDEKWASDKTKIYSIISEVKRNLEDMRDISEDLNTVISSKSTSPRIVDQANTYSLGVENLRSSLRQLQRDFQLAISSRERQDLFSLSRSPFDTDHMTSVRKRNGGAADISSGATERLLHSRKVLLETLQRNTETIGALATSSTSIQENDEELKNQGAVISVSKKLLTKYGRRNFTDKILICLALLFFFACVAYVVQKRLF